ncbi:MAG: DUF5011 domain-containing protein [Gallionella sp.]|nr:DUF5011 domain-containing protein [Gallionella sp.]
MMKHSIAIGLFVAASMASAFQVCAADTIALDSNNSQPLAVVGAYARHVGDKIVYHYRVTNYSQQNITAVTIGHDDQNDGNPNNDVNELASLPSGWTEKLGIPSTSSNGPTGWRVSVIAPEDNVPHAIAWEPLSNLSSQIRTGRTSNRMSISLDKADSSYLSGHALVTFDDGTTLTVPIDQLDMTPPDLTVILSPDTIVSQAGKLVPIKASFILKDDYDRYPAIRLESITANEFLEPGDISDASYGLDDRYFKLLAVSRSFGGRIYTVTYSATDASGNQTVASATVTVTQQGDTPVTGSIPSQ